MSESQYLYDEIRKQRERINTLEGNCDRLQATATRRLELLRRCHAELLRVRDFVDYEPYELLDELAKELADEDSTGGISHAVGSQD